MRLLLIILGFICAITGLFFSIFSMGLITIIPVLIAFMAGLGAVKLSNQQMKKTTLIRFIFIIIIATLLISIYNAVLDDSTRSISTESVENMTN